MKDPNTGAPLEVVVQSPTTTTTENTRPEKRIPPKSHQVRALGRKTLAYQKRQMCTNICCVGCCPAMMVIISAVLGAVIQGLIDKNNEIKEVVYCSNIRALDNVNSPIFNIDDPGVPKTGDTINGRKIANAALSQISHVNFLKTPDLVSQMGSGAFGFTSQKPCVEYLAANYPFTAGDIYALDPAIPAASNWSRLDSTYSPQPTGGWLSSNAFDLYRIFVQWQLRPWYYYTVADGVDASLLGTRPATGVIPISLANASTVLSGDLFKPSTVANGMLDTFERRYYVALNQQGINGVEQIPWFESATGNMDVTIGQALNAVLEKLSSVNKTVLREEDPSPADTAAFLASISEVTKSLPYGGIAFNKLDHPNRAYEYVFHIGTDTRLDKAAGFPPAGQRQLVQQAQLSNAILRTSNPATHASSQITQSVRAFPWLRSTKFVLPFSSFMGRVLFPFAISFLLPFFVVTLVKEKEDRIFGMMRMNGLKTWTYWLAHYIHFYSLHVMAAIVFLVAGRIAKIDMFVRTNAGVLIIIFFMWGHLQVAVAFFFATLFNHSRSALVVTFLVVLCSVLVSLAGDTLFTRGQAPSAYFIWPPFAFFRILTVVNQASYRSEERPYTVSMIRNGDEVYTALMFMLWEWFVLMALAFWLGGDGWRKSVLWFKTRKQRKHMAKQVNNHDELEGGKGGLAPTDINDPNFIRPEYLLHEDPDVIAERDRVKPISLTDPKYPLILKNLRKQYPTGKTALKTLTMAAESNMVFGLLGPNGAGKSTTISILTGLYESTGGQASIDGYDINTEREGVWRVVGVCPQHDVLWEDLTCEEHLLFYARLKGIDKADEAEVVEQSLKTVALNGPFKNRRTKGLSGGEKRRLSIAIALVGHPKVVFLDEPTTGLDPEVRRLIWNIITEARKNRTIVLTTHSMEEAEVLCQRIGIVSQGTLRCIGTPHHLKSLYANSFRIVFSVNEEKDLPKAKAFVEGILGPAAVLSESYATQAAYEVPKGGSPPASSYNSEVEEEEEEEENTSTLATTTGGPVPTPTPILKSKSLAPPSTTHSRSPSATSADGSPTRIGAVFDQMEAGKTEAGIVEWGLGETTLEEVFVQIIGVDGEDALGS
ncbi:hypothetical protein DFS34DRAFT_596408 [Phlyctochytrium arcticum]|nr:hypothetical protein DFS34DRAFT_596408 [Phlyctochytrium arcticum]